MLDFGSIQRKFVVGSGWCQIFVEIKHFWLLRPKIIHVSELISAEYVYTVFEENIILNHIYNLSCFPLSIEQPEVFA